MLSRVKWAGGDIIITHGWHRGRLTLTLIPRGASTMDASLDRQYSPRVKMSRASQLYVDDEKNGGIKYHLVSLTNFVFTRKTKKFPHCPTAPLKQMYQYDYFFLKTCPRVPITPPQIDSVCLLHVLIKLIYWRLDRPWGKKTLSSAMMTKQVHRGIAKSRREAILENTTSNLYRPRCLL